MTHNGISLPEISYTMGVDPPLSRTLSNALERTPTVGETFAFLWETQQRRKRKAWSTGDRLRECERNEPTRKIK